MGALRKLRRAGGRRSDLEPLLPGQSLPVRKMSEVLLEFAQPMLDAVNDDRYFRMLVQFAAMCWDISMYPQDKQKALLNKALNDLPASGGPARPVLDQCARTLIARRKALFHYEKRAIMDVKFVGEGENEQVFVIWALAKD